MGEAPPTGATIVMSTPATFSTMAALPISIGASSSNFDADAVAAALERRHSARASASAATDNTKCADPCGDIKQLQSDVAQLKEIVVNLTNVVEALDKKIAP